MLILLESMFKSGKCPKSLNENHNIRKKEGILILMYIIQIRITCDVPI